MVQHLCISVTFLDPLFHGQGDSEPEWPPSPMRLYQALVAGSRSGRWGSEWSNAKAEAFRWLEACDPPAIIAPAARQASRYLTFVPNNDSDRAFERQERLATKAMRPLRLMDTATLHYVWRDIGDGSVSRARIMCSEAQHVHALGWGIDQVVSTGRLLSGLEVSRLPGQQWRPWAACRTGMPTSRAPVAGSLEELEAVHDSQMHRLDQGVYRAPLKLRRFRTVPYLRAGVLPPRSYAAFELPEGVAFPQRGVARAAAMLRSLTCRREYRDDFSRRFPGLDSEVFVAGHVGGGGHSSARFSYVPLPTIGHKHADGLVRRFLVVEPYGFPGGPADWAQRRLLGATLTDSQGIERGALLDLWRPQSRRMLAAYVGQATEWSTVTPVVLPGYDDGKHAKAQLLFLKALGQAGLPHAALSDFTLRKAPYWPGSESPNELFAPSYLRGYSRWHIALRFREPVSGPLTIGAGRHVGLGLFAAVPDHDRDA